MSQLVFTTNHSVMIRPQVLKVYSDISEGKPALKAIREALSMSQEKFAQTIGVASVTVSRWERGVAPMTLNIKQIKRFEALLQELNMRFQDLPDEMGKTKQKD